MAGILNNSARRITLNHKTKRGTMIKYVINPLQLTEIPKEHWILLKKNKVINAWIEKGDLVVGGKKKIILPDDFEPDLTEDEIKEIEEAEALAEQKALEDSEGSTEGSTEGSEQDVK